METPLLDHPARPLMIVGGDLALDFANTVDDPFGPAHFDHLSDVIGLLSWAEQRELVTAPERANLEVMVRRRRGRAALTLGDTHRLRIAIQSTFSATAVGRDVPEDAWRVLRMELVAAIAHASLEQDGNDLRPTWTLDSPDAIRWPIAYAAHQLLTGGQLARVKQCAGCPWLYLDHSKNSSRRWCTMEDCGKNEKMRRYVERRAARRQSS